MICQYCGANDKEDGVLVLEDEYTDTITIDLIEREIICIRYICQDCYDEEIAEYGT